MNDRFKTGKGTKSWRDKEGAGEEGVDEVIDEEI